MAELKYWTPLLKWLSVVADEPADDDAEPEVKGISSGITVTPTIGGRDARALRAEDLSPTAALLALAPFEARLDDGLLKLTATQRLRLVANSAVLDLPDGVSIWYEFKFHHTTYNGAPQELPTIVVDAPFIAESHSDNVGGPGVSEVTKNLATAEWLNDVAPVNGEVFVRHVPDDVELVAGGVQFYSQGEPLGDPLDLDVLLFDMSVIDGGTAELEGLETVDGGGPETPSTTSVDVKRMQQRRGLLTTWNTVNPVPSPGELCVALNVDGSVASVRIGDGVHTWSTLNALYTKPGAGIPAADMTAAVQTSLGKADTALQSAPAAPVSSVAGKTGAVTLVKGDVGLGAVDNTADSAKPVSTVQQAALDLKAPLASPAFTGTPTGLTKSHVGLSSVDNTADTAKPVSALQAAADLLKADKATTVTGANSVTGGGDLSANRTLSLVNDTATPGATKVYGTDGSGVKGWQTPSGGGSSATITAHTTTATAQTVPAGTKGVFVTVIAPGGAGGSGRRGAAGTARCAGSGGGAGGYIPQTFIPASALGATYTATVPAAPAGGAAVTANDTNGNNGAAGAVVASFATGSITFAATGGGSGLGGTTSGQAGGVTGSGLYGSTVFGAASTGNFGQAGNNGVNSPAGGGSGGSIDTGNTAWQGGSGGSQTTFGLIGGSGGGANAGASPGAGSAAGGIPGGGGGGGGSGSTVAAQAGATPLGYGAGGGGGGGSLNGFNSGAGGNGGPGLVLLAWIF